MPTQHRWIVPALLLTGALVLIAAAGLALGHDGGRLTYTVPAGRAQNNLTLRLSGANIELLDGATQAVLQSRPLAGTQQVSIQGQAGNVDDTLMVDLSGGALALPEGIHFDGGAGGYDTLVVTGGESGPGSYEPTGPGAGVLTHAGTRIFFSNLEPVLDTTTAVNYTITLTSASETINVVNGPTCGLGCQTTQVNSLSIEAVDFANKTNVTVNGNGGADTFKVASTVPATGLSKLVLDGGGNLGDGIAIANFVMAGGTLSLTNVVTVTQSGVISVTNLAVQAAGLINLFNGSNHVSNFAANATGSGAPVTFASAVPTVTVSTVAGLAGIKTVNGSILVNNTQLGGAVVVSNAIATGGGILAIFADHMTLTAALNAGSGSAYLDNQTFPEPIVLGTKPANMLGLLQSDLNQITAGVLQIGDFGTDTGGITVTANIAAPAGWSTLDLRQHANITADFSASLTVPNLAVRAHAGNVNIGFAPSHVNTLAGATTGGNFSYEDDGHFSLGTVAGVSGVSTAGGNLSVGTTRGGLAVNQNVLAGAGTIDLGATESSSTADNLDLGPGVLVSTTAGDIFMEAGDHLTLEPGSVVDAGGAGNAILAFSVSDTDNLGGGTIAGTIASAHQTPKIEGGAADETLLFDFAAGASLPDELVYDGGDGQNSLTISDAGDSAPHLYEASGLGMSRDLANLIHTSRVQVMTAIGGSGADQFGFRPDAGVTFHAIGGLPGSAPGDELLVNDLTATNPVLTVTAFDATGQTGQWTFGNRLPVDFTGIDSFSNLSRLVYLPLTSK